MALACGKGPEKEVNIFSDEVMQKIYTLQDERNTGKLFDYFQNDNSKYRRAAALAFASIRDTAAVLPLAALLADKKEDVRAAAAYSLGQAGDKSAESFLMKAFAKEKSAVVKRDILEAIGKCGTKKGLDFITSMKFRTREDLLLIGQARGIFRFGLRNITSRQGNVRAFELLAPVIPGSAAIMAGHYLARVRGIDLSPYEQQLIDVYNKEKNPLIRMNLILAMGKVKGTKAPQFLQEVITSVCDYRVKVNALRLLQGFDYKPVKELALSLLQNPDANISVSAAEYIRAKGVKEDAELYLKKAQTLSNWRSRAILLSAALRYESGESKKTVVDAIISAYNRSENIYEKGRLLQALGDAPAAYKFVAAQVFSDNHFVIKSDGAAVLTTMRRHKDFPEDDKKLQKEFAHIFKKIIESGDIAAVFNVAVILRDPEMNFKALYENSDFLEETLAKLDLPKDMEAYDQLRRTIAFFRDEQVKTATPPLPKNPIDWQAVTAIEPGQVVKVKTAKGDISIELFVNDSPGSAANFIRLIKEGFNRNNRFHRVISNFVIQAGCPRADGWGGPGFTIRSELGPRYYEEGSVGMASSGKDTEGSQWFITHSPTPHLDGDYTVFGKVVSGMDVVHKIELGDKIIAIEVVK
jgi:cyclophilin family peptidyl-prolyl cis-trans isomerase